MRTRGRCGVSPFPLHQQRSRPAVADEALPPAEVEGAEVTLVDVEVPPAPDKAQVQAPKPRQLQVARREVAEQPAEAVAVMAAAEQPRQLRLHLRPSRLSICG